MQPGERWITAAGALVLVVDTRASRSQHQAGAESPTLLLVACVVISMVGVAMLIGSGASMLASDLILRGFGPPSGWVTPPVVFVLGLVLALTPTWLLRRARDRSVLSLRPAGIAVREGTAAGEHRWDEISADLVAGLPPTGRTVIRHYLEHPEHRVELGTRAARRRAESISRAGG